ncbi:transcriptional repressor LexA [Corynebacterium sp. 335C]
MAPKKKGGREQLTERQRKILEFIRNSVMLRGYAPSIREIGDAVELSSTSSVAYQLKVLETKGYLRRDPHKPRAVDVRALQNGPEGQAEAQDAKAAPAPAPAADEAPEPVPATVTPLRDDVLPPTYVPLVGAVAAGSPITAEQDVQDTFAMPPELLGPGDEFFMLRVQGDSMEDAGMFDGDFVVVRAQETAERGDIVVAMPDGLESEATVKEWAPDSTGNYLLPHNSAYEPIPADDAIILGRVVTLLRRY